MTMAQFLFHIAVAGAIALALPSGRAQAQDAATSMSSVVQPERISAFVETMQIAAMAEVMRSEGLDYGTSLESDMFGGNAGTGWQGAVSAIYDATKMTTGIESALARAFAEDEAALADAEAFFGSELGQRVLGLEVSARRAMLDDAAKDAAELAVTRMVEDRAPRMDLIRRFGEVNDLTEMNVAGAMTSNLAFYQGMQSEGAFDGEMTEEQMMSDVWAQEPQVRADSEKWLMSFLTLAYEPLSDADLEAYIAYSETPSGKRLNAAMFAAFDEVFRTISHDLGAAAARQMKGSDI
jgi:Uncharacterized protein conserved in bacteria (DUF2059)